MLTSLLLESGDARDVLRSIVEADLPACGLAHVISVRAVAQNLGGRWAQRCEAVWEFVARTVQRRAPGVFCVQLNAVDFLIAFPTGEPAAAAARCIDILRDVLQHFLGRADQVQDWVHAIRSLEAELNGFAGPSPEAFSVAGERSRSIARGPLNAASAASPSVAPSPTVGAAGPRWTQIPSESRQDFAEWKMASGEVQRLAMELRPVWSLQHQAVSSFRLYRGFSPIAVGYGADRERLDLGVLDYATGPAALGFLQQRTFLHLPVALSTLMLQRTRLRYLEKLQAARHLFRQRVLLELEAVDRGVVESRLQEVVHLLRPFFRLVLASSTGQPLRGSTLRSVGVSGCIIDLASMDEPMTPSTLLTRISRAQRESPIVVVHGLFEGEVSDTALRDAGASHMSSRPGGRTDAGAGLEPSSAMVAEAAELRRVASLIQQETHDPYV